jgi:hypothetical protein
MVFNVKIDGRTFTFYSGMEALDFLVSAARAITQKSWESELPDLGIVLDIKDQEEPKPAEEPAEDLEQLEKECEA